MIKFNYRYFIVAIILFLVEFFIALYVHDDFVRPHIGDLLVVILIYCLLKSFLDAPVLKMAIIVLLFPYAVEILQYFKIINIFGLQHSRFARIIIGTTFSWADMLAYTVGILFVLIVEIKFLKKTL